MRQVDYVIKNYVSRLIRKLCPSTTDQQLSNTISDEIYGILSLPHSQRQNGRNIQNFRIKYINIIGSESVDQIIQTLYELLQIGNRDDLASYLVSLDSHSTVSPSTGSEQQADSLVMTPLTSPNIENSNINTEPSLYKRITPYNSKINQMNESEIVRSLMFTLGGSTSDLLPFDNNVVVIPKSLSFGQVGQLYEILEPCLLYRKLSDICSNLTSDSGEIKSSFFTSVQNELFRYTSYIGTIFNPNQPEDDENGLTLRKLHYLLLDWIDELRFLNYLELCCETYPTDKFLSILYQLSMQGNPKLKEVDCSIFNYCSEPFKRYVRSWVLNGDLDFEAIGNEHFFITSTKSKQLVHYSYHKSKVPLFLSSEQAYLIYQIGKTLAFLKHDCGELVWCKQFGTKYEVLLSNSNIAEWDFQDAYTEVVNHTFEDVLCKKYQLIDELSRLHKFLLMRQGDFIDAIIEKGINILNQPTNSLSSHMLLTMLQNAVDSTSVGENYGRDVLNRLDARILYNNDYGSTGWSKFTLDYEMTFPLSKIFMGDHKEYLRMFNFLIKLRKLTYLLNEGWQDSTSLGRTSMRTIIIQTKKASDEYTIIRKKRVWILRTFKRLNVLRNEFVKFMSCLMGYFDNDVIDSNYRTFINKVKSLKVSSFESFARNRNLRKTNEQLPTLKMEPLNTEPTGSINQSQNECRYNTDELVKLHQDYIYSISRCKFLSLKKSSCGKHTKKLYIHQLETVIDIINKFVDLNKEYNGLIVEMISISEVSERGGNINEDKYADYLNHIDDKLDRLSENLTGEIINKFEDCLNDFAKDLRIEHDPDLRFLGISLSDSY